MKAVSLALAAAFAAGHAFALADSSREWAFDVSLDGRPIGEHRYALRETAGARELTSEARFRVRILFFDAYRYDHWARERWTGDCLDGIDARTDANGERSEVAGQLSGAAFRVTAGDSVAELGSCVQTFAYWNPSILEARRLLNPQTGEYVSVEVRPLGREVVAGQPAERFRLTGGGRVPLEIDLWYTPAREWVALESRTPEGRVLRYSRK